MRTGFVRWVALGTWVAGLLLLPSGATGQEPVQATPRAVLHLSLAAAIDPVASRRIQETIDEAARTTAAAVVVEMDTPGGLLTATREIVQMIFASPVPVIVYVGPSGARAGSAGVFITLAAHVAAMAPGTNIGAAHPVAISSPGGGQGMGETMEAKVTNDAAAFARSIAERRGRNAEWAEGAVRESTSVTENEALKDGVIDLIAADLPALLAACDGRTVELPSGPTVLHTKGATIVPVETPFKYRFLGWLANPNTAYLLMLLGVYGLIFELSNPGAIFPGVAGAIALVLAAFALGMLPFNATGIALIVLALALFAIDLFVPTHGILSTGGVVAFVIGSIMLFDVPDAMDFGIAWQVLIPATAATAAFFLFAVGLGLKAQQRRAVTGQGGLVGEIGRARTELSPAGKVFLHGEIWNARASRSVAVGDTVRVVAVRGMQLEVEPVAPERSGPDDP
jgi:membrane-bound serine protease (ClpP class)